MAILNIEDKEIWERKLLAESKSQLISLIIDKMTREQNFF